MIQNSLDQKDSDHNDSDRSDDSQDDSLKPSLHNSVGQNVEIAASVPKVWNWSTF